MRRDCARCEYLRDERCRFAEEEGGDGFFPGVFVGAAIMTIAVMVGLLLDKMCEASEISPFRAHAEAVLRDPDLSQLKRDLFSAALVHGAKPMRCKLSYYHPREAGHDWRRWQTTATGSLVRPGVACVHTSRWDTLGGAWLWVPGYGLAHVEDRDAYRQRQSIPWFDLAVPGPPHSYADWLADFGRVRLARDFGLRPGTVYIVKPRGGWEP